MSRFIPRPGLAATGLGFLLLCGLMLTAGCGGGPSDEATDVQSSDLTPETSAPADPADAPDPAGTPDRTDAADPGGAPGTATASATNGIDGDDPTPEFVLPPGEVPVTPDNGEDAPSRGLEMPKQNDPTSETGSSGSDSQLRLASWEAIEQTVTSTGQVTVVDLWSLACPPCLKEFPELVRLHQELGDRVHCVGVDLDFDGRKTRPPESYQPKVAEFLGSVDAEFDNYISQSPIDDVLAEVGVVSIPTVLIYDADGNLVKQFVDSGETAGFTYDDDIIPLVRQLAG